MHSGGQPTIHLCFAPADEARALLLHERLSAAGVRCALADSPGRQSGRRHDAIRRQLRSASRVLVLLSRNSTARGEGLHEQIRIASEVWDEMPPGQAYLIPVKLEECDIGEKLAQFHWVNAWEESGWRWLLEQIRDAVPGRAVPHASPVTASQPARAASAASHGASHAGRDVSIPYVTFPSEVRRFLMDSMPPDEWRAIPEETRRFVLTLGCKLEPIVQIVPATPVPLVLGFECLGLGALGESFQEICRRAAGVDPGLLRLCLAVVSIKTVSSLRSEAIKSGYVGARNLLFTINIDPFMLDSAHFKKLLRWYYTDLSHNVLFEVNETTTKQYLPKLKNLQVDFNLRYAADDLNGWHPDVRAALIDRVEMTKMDYRSFKDAMSVRGDDATRSLGLLLRHNVREKPLIVEGIEDEDYLAFLERHWDYRKHGHLYGQGYCLDSRHHWNAAIQPLKPFRLPGGSYLADMDEAPHFGRD